MPRSLLLVLDHCKAYLITQTEIRPPRAKLVLATAWQQWVHTPFPPLSEPGLTREPDLVCPYSHIWYLNLLHFPRLFCSYHEKWPFGWLRSGLTPIFFFPAKLQNMVGKGNSYVQKGVFCWYSWYHVENKCACISGGTGKLHIALETFLI